MSLPRLGLLVGTDPPARLRLLLMAVSDRVCAVDALRASGAGPAPAAYLWTSGGPVPPAGVPYAAWLPEVDADTDLLDAAAVILTDDVAAADRIGRQALMVPASAPDPAATPVPPFVRRRLRAARGLPDTPLVRGDAAGWHWYPNPADGGLALDDDAVDAAIAVTAAAVTTGAALLRVLAWGTPCVTDPASAEALGAGAAAVVVTDPDDRLAAAAALAADPRAAARHHAAGTRLVRTRHNLRWSAAEMLRRLRLPPSSLSPIATVVSSLDEFGMPEGSPFARRIRAHLAALPIHADPPQAAGWTR